MRWCSAALTGAWVASGCADWNRFRSALRDPARAQRRVLEEVRSVTRGTAAWGGRFDDLAPRDWTDLQPWIDRAAAGEQGVVSRETVERFEPTSGTAGGSKLIPSTPTQRRQFLRGIRAWVVDLYRRRPGLMAGPAYWSISPALEPGTTAGGIPIGFAQDSEYLGRFGQWLVDRTLAVPGSIRFASPAQFQRTTLLHLLAEPQLRFVSVWSPVFLSALMQFWEQNRDDLERTLHAGVRLNGRTLRRRGIRDPWPRLRLISCWTDGHAEAQLPELRRFFPDVEIQPKGLLSTEGLVSIPFGSARPLAITGHYLEFETDQGRLLRVEQLREGDEACVVLSSGSGLLRYRTWDRVQVTGFLQRTPCVRFLGRQDRCSDLCGEKLTDAFVSQVLRDLGIDGFSILVPETRGYTLYATRPPEAAALDDALGRNVHYRHAVSIGQLRPVRVVRLRRGAEADFLALREAGGMRRGDVKLPALDCRGDFAPALRRLG